MNRFSFKYSLLLLGCLIILLNPNTVFAHSQTYVIRMTPSGFEPQEVTIDTSSAVLFVNQDDKAHWPASNIHPTHDVYPEFDPQKAIEPGQSWPFRPKKAGTFKFHNHINPHFRGTLIVEPEANPQITADDESAKTSWVNSVKGFFSNIFKKIGNIFGKKQESALETVDLSKLSAPAQIEAVKDLAKKQGVEKTWQNILLNFKGQSGTSGNVHDLAHLIGTLIYEDRGFDGIKICSSEFAFGCYHGFLDKVFEESLDNLNKAEVACGSLGQGGPFASCIHGIGHGVASFHQTSDLEKSLSSCQRLKSSGQQYCFDGVFMEFERGAANKFYKVDDSLYPCSELEQKFGTIYSSSCGRNQPPVLMGRFNFEFEEVVDVCLSASSIPIKEACIDSLGFIAARAGEVEQIIQACQKIGEDGLAARCTKAAAGELIFQETPDWQKNAPKVCESLSGNYLLECKNYLEILKKDYGR